MRTHKIPAQVEDGGKYILTVGAVNSLYLNSRMSFIWKACVATQRLFTTLPVAFTGH